MRFCASAASQGQEDDDEAACGACFHCRLYVYLFLQLRRIHPTISCRQEMKESEYLHLLLGKGQEETHSERLPADIVVLLLFIALLSRSHFRLPLLPLLPPFLPSGCENCCVFAATCVCVCLVLQLA